MKKLIVAVLSFGAILALASCNFSSDYIGEGVSPASVAGSAAPSTDEQIEGLTISSVRWGVSRDAVKNENKTAWNTDDFIAEIESWVGVDVRGGEAEKIEFVVTLVDMEEWKESVEVPVIKIGESSVACPLTIYVPTPLYLDVTAIGKDGEVSNTIRTKINVIDEKDADLVISSLRWGSSQDAVKTEKKAAWNTSEFVAETESWIGVDVKGGEVEKIEFVATPVDTSRLPEEFADWKESLDVDVVKIGDASIACPLTVYIPMEFYLDVTATSTSGKVSNTVRIKIKVGKKPNA